jgi:hypothetical protein
MPPRGLPCEIFPIPEDASEKQNPQRTGWNLADGLARRLSLDRLVKQEMRFIEGDAGGSRLEGARDLPVFFLQTQGRQNLTESMRQAREKEAAPSWLLLLALLEIAWIGAISLALYWLLTS